MSWRTVSRVMKWFSCRRMDSTLARSADLVEATSISATRIVPSLMPSSLPIIMSSVDLPAPLGPMSAVTPPAGMSSSTGPMETSEL